MKDVRYMISEAAKLVGVEQHTLRYWEDELELNIPRNELGHRYYRDSDIKLLQAVKSLKEKGYQLRAIKMLIPEIQKKNLSKPDETPVTRWEDSDSLNEELALDNSKDNNSIDKLDKFRLIMKDLIAETLEDNNGVLAETVNEKVSDSIIKEMDYLLRIKEEKEEERFKELDRTIREVQSAREEAATSNIFNKKKKRVKFFK